MKNKLLNQNDLLKDLIAIIEQGKQQAVTQVNSRMTLVFWQVGKRINEDVLQKERAKYGKQVIEGLSKELVVKYGRSFQVRNIRRMIQFATVFQDWRIVSPLATQLSWTHFVIVLSLKSQAARLFYATKAAEARWGKRELTRRPKTNG